VNLYLVRHAHAGDRLGWDGPDAERPLSKKGRRQAEAIADVLGVHPIGRVLSSPAVRCLQTAGPIAARLGVEIEANPAFAEGAALPEARALVDQLASDGKDAILCGHGDLIPAVLHDLELEGVRLEGVGCAKGSIWHLVADGTCFVRGVYHRAADPELAAGS
jgi:phosphohistidine phosphatase SixA